MGAAAAIASAVIAAAGTGYSIHKQNEAAAAQRKFQKEQSLRQEQLLADQQAEEEKLKIEEGMAAEEEAKQSEASQNRSSAKARQRQKAMAAYGRSDTILTGPSGVVQEPERKTILGV